MLWAPNEEIGFPVIGYRRSAADFDLRIEDSMTGELLARLPREPTSAAAVAVTSEGRCAAVMGADGKVELFPTGPLLATLNQIRTATPEAVQSWAEKVSGLAISEDGEPESRARNIEGRWLEIGEAPTGEWLVDAETATLPWRDAYAKPGLCSRAISRM